MVFDVATNTLPAVSGTPDFSALLWMLFLLTLLGFMIYSAVLVFHWLMYAIRAPLMWPTTFIYFVVSIILIFLLLISALAL